MLDLDLDLEADLGIDTVKQAQMFAAIREPYGIERDDTLQLRDFPTLAHVIQFVYDRRADLAPAGAEPEAEAEGEGDGTEAAEVTAAPESEFPRRVPTAVLRPPLEHCRLSGVELRERDRVVLMPDRGGVGDALVARLKRRGVEVLVLERESEAEGLTEQIESWSREGPICGLYWLPALDEEGDVYGMGKDQWKAAIRVRVELLFAAARALYESIGRAGGFLISATRLGGRHGYDEEGAVAPLGGAVTGFTKTFRRERGEALAKVVDVPPSCGAAALANLLIQETLRDPGAVEVGYASGRRWTVSLVERPLEEEPVELQLGKETVFLVTGAAGSIVSAIVADLAVASGGTFHLLDLTPEPDPENPDLERLSADPDGLKRELFERIKAGGERATPAKVEKKLAALERAAAARAAIDAVRAAGGKVFYHPVDLLDAEAVGDVVEEVRQRNGRIDVLLHAAGLEVSHFLPDKKQEEFALVFDVKSDGWFHLLRAIGDMPLGATVAFSSIAGRFGNAGQADYSAANDLLCKLTSNLLRSRPETRGVVIDWTAWGEIGMATRGSIPAMMKEAGIDMLPPEIGVPIVRNELVAGTRGEVLVAGGLGVLDEEWDVGGGLDPEVSQRISNSPLVMIGRIGGMTLAEGLIVETELDPVAQPFLFDHRIDGTPVLPGVMGIEAFAESASLLFPDLRVVAVENIRFLAPFKFYRDEPRTLRITSLLRAEGADILADCRLIGRRRLAGREEPQVTTHFAARVRLSFQEPEKSESEGPPPCLPEIAAAAREDIYRIYFHGAAYRVVESAWQEDGAQVGLFPANLPPDREPADLPMLMSPRLIELCFQTAGLAELAGSNRMGLPRSVARIERLADPAGARGRLFGRVWPADGGFDGEVIDESGRIFLRLEGYRTIELPAQVDDELLEPLRQTLGAGGDSDRA
jgi:NAD(P)-dependent dehydrogenase (short-subunit alcohol dehydrogenase family)/acyl carrier protein